MILRAALAALAVLLTPVCAAAMSAADLGTIPANERATYIGGAIEMAIYSSSEERGKCIDDWYFGEGGTGPEDLAIVFHNYPDKPAAGLLKVLIDRKCGQ